MNIISQDRIKIWFTRYVQDIILEEAPELERDLESQIKEIGSGESATKPPSLRQVLVLGHAMLPLRLWLASDSLWYSSAPISRHADVGLSGCNSASTEKSQMVCTKANIHGQEIDEITWNMFIYAWNHAQIISMKAYVIH